MVTVSSEKIQSCNYLTAFEMLNWRDGAHPMSGYHFLIGLILFSSSATDCQADGALEGVLSQAKSFEAQFLNLAENNAELLGGISINLITPLSFPETREADAILFQDVEYETISSVPSFSSIVGLSSSATGTLQTGTINVTVTQHGTSDAPHNNPMLIDTRSIHEHQVTDVLTHHGTINGLIFQNSGKNTANVDASQSVIVQGAGANISNIDTGAIGAMSTGSISITVSSD